MENNWEKEFDQKFPNKIAEVIDDFGASMKPQLKSFIRTVEVQAESRVRAELKEKAENLDWTCCGGGCDKDEGYEKFRTDLLALLSRTEE